MDKIDVLVIGGGVVGIAIARALAVSGRQVVVVERYDGPGMETSSRNSEVIHAGIYYRPGSAKAYHCVRGRDMLYDYCVTRGIAHRRLGKLIVAADESEFPTLDRIEERAAANGVADDAALRRIDAVELSRLEPEVLGVGALLSPSTGIIDSHSFMLSMIGDAEAHGALFAWGSEVDAIYPGASLEVSGSSQGEAYRFAADQVVVAGGHGSAPLMRRAGARNVPETFELKGNYFSLMRRAPFRHLIYPVPVPGGLGVHATLDLAGAARFGPDTEPVVGLDYTVATDRIDAFTQAIARYWPTVRSEWLAPAYAGVRPKIRGADGEDADFLIHGPAQTDIAGLFALYGIESPGLTTSLSLAETVRDMLG